MKTRNVAILIFENAEVLDFSGPFEAFNVANEVAEELLFHVYTVAETEEVVSARNGFKIIPDYSIENCPDMDILIISGGNGRKIQMRNKVITDWVKMMYDKVELLLTVCTGVFIAGHAGVLNVTKATTHHLSYDEFKETFPEIELVEDVKYVDNGKIITSGGISAGINMSLHVIDKLIGNNHGAKTADEMEYDY
jgi:transcriptional regulator GlxA family with amidase domain